MSETKAFIKKRRRVPRRTFQRKIGVLIDGKYHITRSHEIGEGGMLISAPGDLIKGKRLLISFQIPGMVHVVVRATIRYVLEPNEEFNEVRYGARFETIDFSSKRLIRNYVASKSAAESVIEKQYI